MNSEQQAVAVQVAGAWKPCPACEYAVPWKACDTCLGTEKVYALPDAVRVPCPGDFHYGRPHIHSMDPCQGRGWTPSDRLEVWVTAGLEVFPSKAIIFTHPQHGPQEWADFTVQGNNPLLDYVGTLAQALVAEGYALWVDEELVDRVADEVQHGLEDLDINPTL